MGWLDKIELADAFFEKRGALYTAVRRVARRMAKERIPYAVIGSMAMAAHGYRMYTGEVIEVVTTAAGAEVISSLAESMPHVQFKVRCVAECPETIEIDGYRAIMLPKLIELKLASGLTAPGRMRDLSDVQDLIVALNLPLMLADSLDRSVRDEYLRIWNAAQSPDALKE